MNRQSIRTGLLAASAVLMAIGAAGYIVVLLPDLHGNVMDIGVRPSVLGRHSAAASRSATAA